MSMHNTPLSPMEFEGLRAHGLDIGTPSQLSDVFRQGIAWALSHTSAAEKSEPDHAAPRGADALGTSGADHLPILKEVKEYFKSSMPIGMKLRIDAAISGQGG